VSLAFLSPEWADALTAAVNAGDAFAQAAGAQRAKIQQVITSADRETRYWTTIEDGRIAMGMGDVDAPDATITQSYDTAVALARRELSPVTGFMMGKIKVGGNMGLLMGLASALGKLADAMAELDVRY
jgi:putative sterol carrier protein